MLAGLPTTWTSARVTLFFNTLSGDTQGTYKNLAGLLGKLVECLALHFKDLHVEGKQVLPNRKFMVRGGENEPARAKTTLKITSPFHSFFTGHGTNEESSVHILRENIKSGVIMLFPRHCNIKISEPRHCCLP